MTRKRVVIKLRNCSEASKEKPPKSENDHKGYDLKSPLIPYWADNLKGCVMSFENEFICIDYCSFRFGLNPG
ncbi:hypothetical protein ACTXT7_009785 [Hymenolepis weldensis]